MDFKPEKYYFEHPSKEGRVFVWEISTSNLFLSDLTSENDDMVITMLTPVEREFLKYLIEDKKLHVSDEEKFSTIGDLVFGSKAYGVAKRVQRKLQIHDGELFRLDTRDYIWLLSDEEMARPALLEGVPKTYVPPQSVLPENNTVPFTSNPNFVGRDKLFFQVSGYFSGTLHTIKPITVALTGVGGVGKTQFAVSFCHRYGQFFPGGIFWLNFSPHTNTQEEIVACGVAMKLFPIVTDIETDDKIQMVLSEWKNEVARLLIFDNCDDEGMLDQWLPRSGACRVLLTSRRPTWSPHLVDHMIPLSKLERNESLQLMNGLCEGLEREDETEKIAQELGDLPLALYMAGCFLRLYKNRITPREYLEKIQSPVFHMSLEGRGAMPSPTGHDLHVARTFAASVAMLQSKDKIDELAKTLLVRACYLSPGNPFPGFLAEYSNDEEIDGYDFEDAWTKLSHLGLIERSGEELWKIHRLIVKYVLHDFGDSKEQASMEARVALKISELLQENKFLEIREWAQHSRYMADRAIPRNDDEASALCLQVGVFLEGCANYKDALFYFRKSLEIISDYLGTVNPLSVHCLTHIGWIMSGLNDLQESRRYHAKAVGVCKKVHGKHSIQLATSLGYVGRIYLEIGAYEKAKRVFEHVLEIFTNLKHKGNESSEAYTNYALALQRIGYYDKALESFQIALEHNDNMECDISSVEIFEGIGFNYFYVGEYDNSEKYLTKVLETYKGSLCGEHPRVSTVLLQLSAIHDARGDHQKAKDILIEAVNNSSSVLGEDHYITGVCMGNLGRQHFALQDIDSAFECYNTALTILEQSVGIKHPQAASFLNALGHMLLLGGALDEAEGYISAALEINSEIFGEAHPEIAANIGNLGLIYKYRGEYEIAKGLYEKNLEINKAYLGDNHPDIAKIFNNMGCLSMEFNDIQSARFYLESAVRISRNNFGDDHKDTHHYQANLTALDGVES